MFFQLSKQFQQEIKENKMAFFSSFFFLLSYYFPHCWKQKCLKKILNTYKLIVVIILYRDILSVNQWWQSTCSPSKKMFKWLYWKSMCICNWGLFFKSFVFIAGFVVMTLAGNATALFPRVSLKLVEQVTEFPPCFVFPPVLTAIVLEWKLGGKCFCSLQHCLWHRQVSKCK